MMPASSVVAFVFLIQGVLSSGLFVDCSTEERAQSSARIQLAMLPALNELSLVSIQGQQTLDVLEKVFSFV